jgi:hypothetical protein
LKDSIFVGEFIDDEIKVTKHIRNITEMTIRRDDVSSLKNYINDDAYNLIKQKMKKKIGAAINP